MDSKNIQAIVIIITLVLFVGGAYLYFSGSGAPITSDLTAVAPDASGQQVLSKQLLSALSSLSSLKLNTDFFKDKAFNSLVDYSEAIKEDPLGRDNPFLPVQ